MVVRFGFLLVVLFAIGSAAQAAVFNIHLDGQKYDGGGTIEIDDSLIGPNALVLTSDTIADIQFDGITFIAGFDQTTDNSFLIFDGLGDQIIGTDDQNGQSTDYSDVTAGTFYNIISLLDGTNEFIFRSLDTSSGSNVITEFDRGTYKIERAVAVIPLPSTLSFALTALLGLVLAARRRRDV